MRLGVRTGWSCLARFALQCPSDILRRPRVQLNDDHERAYSCLDNFYFAGESGRRTEVHDFRFYGFAMRSSKGSRRIVVEGHEYRWKATGDDGYISVGIWPTSNIGGYIHGTLPYDQTWLDMGNGCRSSAGDQIVVTNRLVRRVICHAIAAHGYDPNRKSKELNLRGLDDIIQWDDAVRAPYRDPRPQMVEVPAGALI